MRRVMNGVIARSLIGVPLVFSLALGGCDTVSSVKASLFGGDTGPKAGQQGFVQGFIGGAVADEPRAAQVGREVLSAGGSAADAAVAMGFALSVTLPSRAGLGGGGVCIAYGADTASSNGGVPQSVSFAPLAPTSSLGGDRPAGLPLMARGMFLLHARYGSLPFASLVQKAEELAHFGVPASRAFVRDLALVSGPLFADAGARNAFSRGGAPLAEGQAMVQPELAGTLAQLRLQGVGDLYQGGLARRLVEASRAAGGPLNEDQLRAALPGVAPAIMIPYRNDQVAFSATPNDGGLAAAAAFTTLVSNPTDFQGANARALAAAARYRAGGGDAQTILAAGDLPAASLPSLPASTTFGALDRKGNAVMCAVTMGNLFGTGRVLSGLGFLEAASPAMTPTPLLSVGLAYNPREHAFHAAAAGSGQAGAPLAAAVALINALNTGKPMSVPVPEPGRANAMVCASLLPGRESSCAIASDPRDSGLAAGGG
jgi:gamma-glutamyltranspeptidase / glutathione hydrolase